MFQGAQAFAAADAVPCEAVKTPRQPQNHVAVTGTYAGQTYEFRITVDGKPVDPEPTPAQTLARMPAECLYTS